jgi:hypothetical protein
MDKLFGGGSEQKLNVYGELPGRETLGGSLSDTLSGWLKAYGAGTGGLPGTAEAQNLWSAWKPTTGLGSARLQEMLSPSWLTGTPPGLADIENVERAQTERDIANNARNMLMQFGRAGQTLSSPMVNALTQGDLEARQALMERTGQRRLGSYEERLGMLPQLIQMAQQYPEQALAMLGERGNALLSVIMQYLQSAKGEPFVTESADQGWLSGALPAAAGAAAKGWVI